MLGQGNGGKHTTKRCHPMPFKARQAIFLLDTNSHDLEIENLTYDLKNS